MRYELNFDEDKIMDIKAIGDNGILDLKDCCDLLNEQEATIKELEETNKTMYKRLKEQSEIIYQLIQKLKEHMTEKELNELIEDWGL